MASGDHSDRSSVPPSLWGIRLAEHVLRVSGGCANNSIMTFDIEPRYVLRPNRTGIPSDAAGRLITLARRRQAVPAARASARFGGG
jgi:hypothetical protein